MLAAVSAVMQWNRPTLSVEKGQPRALVAAGICAANSVVGVAAAAMKLNQQLIRSKYRR